jgi:hypothetical protein
MASSKIIVVILFILFINFLRVIFIAVFKDDSLNLSYYYIIKHVFNAAALNRNASLILMTCRLLAICTDLHLKLEPF